MPDFGDFAALLGGAFGGYAEDKERRFNQERLRKQDEEQTLVRQTQMAKAQREAAESERKRQQDVADQEKVKGWETWAGSDVGRQTISKARQGDPDAYADVASRVSMVPSGTGSTMLQGLQPDKDMAQYERELQLRQQYPTTQPGQRIVKLQTAPGEPQKVAIFNRDGTHEIVDMEGSETPQRPLTGAQSQLGYQATQMGYGLQQMEAAEKSGKINRPALVGALNNLTGSETPDLYLKYLMAAAPNPETRQAIRGAYDFLEAHGRISSGKAITGAEMAKHVFQVIGGLTDDPAEQQYNMEKRRALYEAALRGAGPGARELGPQGAGGGPTTGGGKQTAAQRAQELIDRATGKIP